MTYEAADALAAAICAQAAWDYRSAVDAERKAIARERYEAAENRHRDADECRRFFRSNACELLCNCSGPRILEALDEELLVTPEDRRTVADRLGVIPEPEPEAGETPEESPEE
jgi:hypothetical protein